MASTSPQLPDNLWQTIQESIPIACVDIVPYRVLADGTAQLGLILRNTPQQGRRWCMTGGRLQLDESVSDALERQLHETFEGGLKHVEPLPQPIIVEFFREKRPGFPVDQRQHALSLTHLLEVFDDAPVAHGDEAYDFRWFSRAELDAGPASTIMGFGQELLLDRFFAEISRQQSEAAI